VIGRCQYADAATVDVSVMSIAVQTAAVSANSGVSGEIGELPPVAQGSAAAPTADSRTRFEKTHSLRAMAQAWRYASCAWARLSGERDFKVYYIPLQQAAALTGAGAPQLRMSDSSAMSRMWAATTGLTRFACRTLRELRRLPWDGAEISVQLFEIGWRSAPLILIAGVVLGIVMTQFVWASLINFGAVDAVIPAELSRTMFRQVGPLMAGLLIAGRVGSAIGAELAVLRLTEQIDAFESLAIDSFRHLVITRVTACAIALPILTILMCFAEIAGGFLWEATHSEMSLSLYVGRVFDRTGWSDYILPTLMSAAAGFAIGTVACYFGYSVEENAVGVRRASTHSVVLSCLFVIALNLLVNQMMSFWFPIATP
jgi:phospholipid/cholesterol/gamma-HCH transport system permease protein